MSGLEQAEKLKAERRAYLARKIEEQRQREGAQLEVRAREVRDAVRAALAEKDAAWLMDFQSRLILEKNQPATVYFEIPNHNPLFIQFHADGGPILRAGECMWFTGSHNDEFDSYALLSDALIAADRGDAIPF